MRLLALRLPGMVRGVTASVVFTALLAFAAPALGARPRTELMTLDVHQGSLSEVVTFQGDGGAACARAGVCGYSGTISYGFQGVRDGGVTVLLSQSKHRSSAFGFANLDVGALTTATVNVPGASDPCTEKVLHKFDGFAFEGDAKSLRVLFHPAEAAPDFLSSYCGGPSDADIAHAGMLPTLTVATRRLRQKKLTLTADSQKPFHIGPFIGTVSFHASFDLRRIRLPRELLQLLTGG
jgi:hypothetical protein